MKEKRRSSRGFDIIELDRAQSKASKQTATNYTEYIKINFHNN